jgi:hypothetical protein
MARAGGGGYTLRTRQCGLRVNQLGQRRIDGGEEPWIVG